jgi:hypothetical protein
MRRLDLVDLDEFPLGNSHANLQEKMAGVTSQYKWLL